MINVPKVLVIDDFYLAPLEVRKLALSLEFKRPARTNYPGERTGNLQDVAPDFYAMWVKKFMDIFGELNRKGEWTFSTQFQRISTNIHDPEANDGWVHSDPSEIIGGVVYLNPEPDPDSGTSIMCPKPGLLPQTNANLRFRNDFYGGRNGITEEEFVRAKQHNNSRYEVDIAVKNRFNRAMIFDCNQPHKQTSFGKQNDYRLTQVFFANKV